MEKTQNYMVDASFKEIFEAFEMTEAELKKMLKRYGAKFKRGGGEFSDEFVNNARNHISEFSIAWKKLDG